MIAIILLALALIAALAAVYLVAPDKVLVSHRYKLVGIPDEIVRMENGERVPVELKTKHWSGREPPAGDRAQVLAYCLLIEENYRQSVSFGILRYADSAFRIPFGDAERQEILGLLSEIQEARKARDVRRNHNRARRCRKCGMQTSCGDALPN
jgi:CRISPR-associated exonuclease Cas4